MKKMVTGLVGAMMLTGAVVAQAADYVKNADAIVKAADWKAMETVTINLNEYGYEGKLTFEAGKAYKLELKNVGEKKHYFTAPEFFKNVATRKAQVNGQAEIKAPYFKAFEVMAGGQLDFYFVAQNKGEYEVFCTIDDHRDQGMDEVLTIK